MAKYSYIRQTPEGDKEMLRRLAEVDWSVVSNKLDVNAMVEEMHLIFKTTMQQSYETITRKKKSSEPPWMNEYIRKLIARRRAMYREEYKRDDEWQKLKKKIRNTIKRRKKKFNEDKKSKMLSKGANFFECVKSVVNLSLIHI